MTTVTAPTPTAAHQITTTGKESHAGAITADTQPSAQEMLADVQQEIAESTAAYAQRMAELTAEAVSYISRLE